jgi:hypothetical protein
LDKECLLYERKCIDCGECLICDLNSNKICDNCAKCIDEESEHRTINLNKCIILDTEAEDE